MVMRSATGTFTLDSSCCSQAINFAVLDWSGAKRGDPLFDYARTRVLLSIGEPPPGTSLTLKLLAKIGRQLLVSSYVRSYERHASERID